MKANDKERRKRTNRHVLQRLLRSLEDLLESSFSSIPDVDVMRGFVSSTYEGKERRQGQDASRLVCSCSAVRRRKLTSDHVLSVAREPNSIPRRSIDKILESMKRRDLDVFVGVVCVRRDGEDSNGSVGGVNDEVAVHPERRQRETFSFEVVEKVRKSDGKEKTRRRADLPTEPIKLHRSNRRVRDFDPVHDLRTSEGARDEHLADLRFDEEKSK